MGLCLFYYREKSLLLGLIQVLSLWWIRGVQSNRRTSKALPPWEKRT